MYKKMGTLVITGALAISLAGCSDTEETAKKVSNDTKTEQTTEKKEEKKKFKVGETIKLGNHKLTVTNVEKSPGGEFDKPKEGHEFLIANVTIENGGEEEIHYNAHDFSLQNSEGNIVDPTLTMINQDTQLNFGKLAQNGKITGTIAFESKQGDPQLQLIFKPISLSEEEVRVNLQ